MVGEYQRQVRPTVADVHVPDPSSARSGLAEGLQALGGGLSRADDVLSDTRHRIAVEEKRRRDTHAATVWAGDLADSEVALQQRLEDMRGGGKAGAYGHEAASEDAVRIWAEERLAAIPQDADPDMVDRLTLAVQKSSARYRSEELGWARAQRSQYEGQQAQKIGEGVARDLYTGLTGPKLDSGFTKIDVLVDSLDMPGNAREEIREKLKHDALTAGFDGLRDRGDDAAISALLQNGRLASLLSAEDMSRYTRSAEAIGRQRKVEAEQAQNEAQSLARDQVNALRIRIDAGDVPGASEFRAVEQAALSAGLPVDDMTRIGVMATQADTARRFQQMDPAGRRRALDGYQAAIAGGTATAEQRIAATSLAPMVEKDEKDQAARLKGLIGQGVEGRVQALASIEGDGETRFNVAEKLQKGWGVLTTMAPNFQRAAFEGWHVRKDRPKDFGTEAEIRRDFGGFVGGAIGGHWGDYMQAAWNVYAADMNASGQTGYDANRFRTIIRYVTGARQRPNGVMEGGINMVRGRPVHLPDFMTASEFDTAMSRMTFGAAVNADGTPARKSDILANLTPRFVGDNEKGEPVYQFVDARNRPLRATGGQAFTATFARAR